MHVLVHIFHHFHFWEHYIFDWLIIGRKRDVLRTDLLSLILNDLISWFVLKFFEAVKDVAVYFLNGFILCILMLDIGLVKLNRINIGHDL